MERLTSADPSRIGAYRLLRLLGEGGMGRVYLARSDRGRTVAVKVVQTQLARQSDFRRRFAQEINAARRVGGEWTAPVLDADTEAETPWVATGYVAGPSLQEVVDESYGPLPESSVSALASGLVRALEAIHGAGLIHRDLKPSNILITIDGPRVIDFGIAHALHTTAGAGLTRTGAVIGSPGFMSPEQVRGEPVTPAADVFCLGAVLAYAATGRMPFGTADSGVHALLFRIAEEEPDLGGITGSLYELIAGCLRKDPAQRPSVAALLTATGESDQLNAAWLPAEVLAELGRHAVQLLDSEDPETGTAPPSTTDNSTGTPPPSTDAAGAGYGPPLHYAQTTASAGPYGGPWQPGAPQPMGQRQQSAYPVTGPLPMAGPMAGPMTGPMTTPMAGPMAGPMTGPLPQVPTKPPQPVRSLATGLVGVLVLVLVVTVVEIINNVATYTKLDEVDNWDFYAMEGLGGYRTASEAITTFSVLSMLPAGVLWVIWFLRVKSNSDLLAPGRARFSSALAALGWFIPVGNLFLPKQIANDIWAASDPALVGRSWPGRRPKQGLLNAWWALWVAQTFFISLLSWFDWWEESSVSSAQGYLVVSLVHGMVAVPSTILAIAVVRRLSRFQEQRLGI